MKISRYFSVGLKALLGSVITAFAMWVFLVIVMVALAARPTMLLFAALGLIILNIFLSGYVLNKLWSWK